MSTTNWDNNRWGHLLDMMHSAADMSSGWLHPVTEGVDDLAIVLRSSMEIVLKKSNTEFLATYFSTSASSLMNAVWNLMPHLEKYLHYAASQKQQQQSGSQENGPVLMVEEEGGDEPTEVNRDAPQVQQIPSAASLISTSQREIPLCGDDPPAEHIEAMEDDDCDEEEEEETFSMDTASSRDAISGLPRAAETTDTSDTIPLVVNSRPPPPEVAPVVVDEPIEKEPEEPVVAARAAPTAAEVAIPAVATAAIVTQVIEEVEEEYEPEEDEEEEDPEAVEEEEAPEVIPAASSEDIEEEEVPQGVEDEDSVSDKALSTSDHDAIKAAAGALGLGALATVMTNSEDDDDDGDTQVTEPLEEDFTTPASPSPSESSLASDEPISPSESSLASDDQTLEDQQEEEPTPQPVVPVKTKHVRRTKITPIKRYSYVPKVLDWAYASFAAPHKAIRRELSAMVASVDEIRARRRNHRDVEAWQIVYFCEWVVDWFGPAIRAHHDSEQELFFPFLATKLQEQHHDLSDAHDEIIARLNAVCGVCKQVLEKEGEFDSLGQLQDLQEEVHCFHNFYCDVMYEEEKTMPAQVRVHFTEQEVTPILEQMYARGGTDGLARGLLPSMMLGEEQCWAAKTSRRLSRSLSKPLRKSFSKKVMPDHLNCIVAKRDAPFLDREPDLERSQHSSHVA